MAEKNVPDRDTLLREYDALVQRLQNVVDHQARQVQMLVECYVACMNPKVAFKRDLIPSAIPASSIPMPESEAQIRANLQTLAEGRELEAQTGGV